VINFKDDPEFSMIPRVSDGQLLFLANNVAKMKQTTQLGSRIAEVHNGSSLFTGDAGSGESNLRRYIIESDYLEAIIALPENMFYNTGIATYIWVVTNRKEERRRGKVQLIDASSLKSPLRKNLGAKNCEFTPELRAQIMETYLSFAENEQSKIFNNEEFGYWKITVERPELDQEGNRLKIKKAALSLIKSYAIPNKCLLTTPAALPNFSKRGSSLRPRCLGRLQQNQNWL
jgi:type I restriction enzyme M protein